MKNDKYVSDSAVLRDLGTRLAAQRLTLNLTQAQLSAQAGVAKRTVERLEAGSPTQLSAFLRICRALGLQERLDLLVPEPAASPVAQLKLKGRVRKRASRQTQVPGVAEPKPKRWTWEP
ncbi:MAG: helix-turn-helix domain-containing protein [Pseudomonadota bacterium]